MSQRKPDGARFREKKVLALLLCSTSLGFLDGGGGGTKNEDLAHGLAPLPSGNFSVYLLLPRRRIGLFLPPLLLLLLCLVAIP